MKTIRGFISKNIFYVLDGPIVFNNFAKLSKSQWLSRSEINGIQLLKLRKLVNYAYHNVPFYHSSMKGFGVVPSDIRTLEDLKKLPILKRKDIQQNFNYLVSCAYPRARLRFSYTSGSTGEPLLFARSVESEVYDLSSYYRFLSWYGWKIGDKIAKIWAFPDILNNNLLKLKRSFSALLRNEILYNSLGMEGEKTKNFIRLVQLCKPSIITGYTSGLLYLSQIINDYNLLPKGNFEWVVLNQAEMINKAAKETIEKSFQTVLYDFYGSREISSIAASCPIFPHLHINAEHRIVEVIKDGESTIDEIGRIVITDLEEYGMPLIRYEIGDLGEKSVDDCSCGRHLPSLAKILGRTSDLLRIDGKTFSFPSFRNIFEDLEIISYRIVQKSEDQIDIFVISGANMKVDILEDIVLGRFRKLIGRDVEFNFYSGKTASFTNKEKHHYVTSEI